MHSKAHSKVEPRLGSPLLLSGSIFGVGRYPRAIDHGKFRHELRKRAFALPELDVTSLLVSPSQVGSREIRNGEEKNDVVASIF